KKPTIQIPGPIRSFARMAALSPELQPDDLLPALARNIVTNGYQATSSNEALEQTEYLKLVIRYLSQARELDKLAGAQKAIRDLKKPTIQIPGPIRSFARMAALSPELQPDDLLPALARNIVTNGYQATSSNEALEQTEYLKLVIRYLSQARELDKLAGAQKAI